MKTDNLINAMIEIQNTGKPSLSENEIIFASHSRFIFVRSLVGEILYFYPEKFATPILLTLLSDKNSEVRSSAAIGLIWK